MLTFIDLFSGIGGFRIAMQNAGFKCVFSSEIDIKACNRYEKYFNERPYGDITKIDADSIPDHDVLCAGFPCQPFSISGRMKGFEDARGTLFFEIARIASIKRPKAIILENVKQLRYHDGGKTLSTILAILEGIGYSVKWKILNASDFGLPQNRERIFIVGILGNPNYDFPIEYNKSKPLKCFLNHSDEWIADGFKTVEIPKTTDNGLIFCGYFDKGLRKNGVRPNTEHLSRSHHQPNRIYSAEGYHPTLSSQETSGRYWIELDGRVRKLEIEECFRIMGFPSDYPIDGSRTELYRQIGNSVAIPVVQAVATELESYFNPK